MQPSVTGVTRAGRYIGAFGKCSAWSPQIIVLVGVTTTYSLTPPTTNPISDVTLVINYQIFSTKNHKFQHCNTCLILPINSLRHNFLWLDSARIFLGLGSTKIWLNSAELFCGSASAGVLPLRLRLTGLTLISNYTEALYNATFIITASVSCSHLQSLF